MRSPIHVEIPSFHLPKLIYREGSEKDFHFDIGEVTNLNWQTFGETPQKVCWGGGAGGGRWRPCGGLASHPEGVAIQLNL